jgi:hypothetical protein
MIVRVLPRQLTEQNEVLRAASEANAGLIETLSRSQADVKTALDSIKASTDALAESVLRAKAENLTSQIAGKAENTERRLQKKADATKAVDVEAVRKAGLDALKAKFPPAWTKVVAEASVGRPADFKTRAEAIGTSVYDRWRLKYGETGDPTTTPTPPPPQDPLADSGKREKAVKRLRDDSAAKAIKVNDLPFTIVTASIVKSTDTGPFDTVTDVELGVTPAGTTKVKRDDLANAVITFVKNTIDTETSGQDVIKSVTLKDPQSDAGVQAVIEP